MQPIHAQVAQTKRADESEARECASRYRLGLRRLLPLTPSHNAKRYHQKRDSERADDVRHYGNRTGGVAGVGPYEADSRSHDKQGHHRSQPVENPSLGDDAELTLMTALSNGFSPVEWLRPFKRPVSRWWRPVRAGVHIKPLAARPHREPRARSSRRVSAASTGA